MSEEEKVNCGIFQQKERKTREITRSLNETRDPKVKGNRAQLLINELTPLLKCLEYDQGSSVCEICRNIINLRKKTAELVIKASKIA
ncbi:MAG: hypothetical protein WC632_06320 [Candidatus Margulisiibacteriota bacterium]